MEKIRLSLFWLTISMVLAYVHISLIYDDAYDSFVLAYIFGFCAIAIFLAFVLHNMYKLARKSNDGFFWGVLKTVFVKIWYWVLVMFIIVFVFNFLRSLIQLFEEKEDISQKIFIFSDPFMGQMFIMILSFILSVVFIRLLYLKIKRM